MLTPSHCFGPCSIMDLKRELDAMGGPAATSRGEMVHLVLTLCRKFETAFGKLIDGGKGGEFAETGSGELGPGPGQCGSCLCVGAWMWG